MKILIGQPIHENHIHQLVQEISQNRNIDAVLFPEGYITNEKDIENARDLAKEYKIIIITGYTDENNKEKAIVIDPQGEIVLQREQTPSNEPLYRPTIVKVGKRNLGYLLCKEILKGIDGFDDKVDFIAHPIGVGMFSEEQFQDWIEQAKKIARKYKTLILGTSHSDGSYNNCGFSIPIAYCIDVTGEAIFVSKNDKRSRIVNIITRKFEVLQ